MADTYQMELSTPIQAYGEPTQTLTLRDPASGALDGVEITLGAGGVKSDRGNLVRVIGIAADIPPSAAKQIPMRDLFQHLGAVLNFFGLDTRETGAS